MKVRVEPAVTKEGDGVPAAYSGFVMMRIPDYFERMELLEEVSEAFAGEEPPPEDETEAQAKRREIRRLNRRIRYLARKMEPFVEEVELTRLADGFKFTSYDEVKHDTELASVVTELATWVVGKHQVGKP